MGDFQNHFYFDKPRNCGLLVLQKVTTTKKRYRKWPGLKASAKQLGCNYAHLRRVVAGQVLSPNLLEKYRAMIEQPGQPLQSLPPKNQTKH